MAVSLIEEETPRGGSPVMREEEAGAVQAQTQEHQGLLGTRSKDKPCNRSSPGAFGDSEAGRPLMSDVGPPELVNSTFLLF